MKLRAAWILGVGGLCAGLAIFAACVGDTPITPIPDAGGSNDTGATNDTGTVNDSGAPDTAITCTAPLTNCANFCVDLTRDKANCGACGHSCLGAACGASKCAVQIVASGLSNPYIAANSTTPDVIVVASSDALKDGGTPSGGLYRIAKPSGAPVKMWTSPFYAMNRDFNNQLSTIAVGGTKAYMISVVGNTASLSYVDLNGAPGTAPTPISIPNGSSLLLFVAASTTDAGSFVAAGSAYQSYARANFDTPIPIFSTGGGAGIAFPDLPYIVIADNASSKNIVRCDRTVSITACSGGGVDVYSGPLASNVKFLTAVGSTLYWVNEASTSTIVSCTLPTCTTPLVIASGEADVGGLAIDVTGAYWTDPISGHIRACTDLSKGCAGASETRVDGQANATGITTDKDAIYWTIKLPAGSVRRIGK
ncbi:hypothetical protein BH09MYX1_BH09MYX1_32070 [soil metagenome]